MIEKFMVICGVIILSSVTIILVALAFNIIVNGIGILP
jgi:hypothetical protein